MQTSFPSQHSEKSPELSGSLSPSSLGTIFSFSAASVRSSSSMSRAICSASACAARALAFLMPSRIARRTWRARPVLTFFCSHQTGVTEIRGTHQDGYRCPLRSRIVHTSRSHAMSIAVFRVSFCKVGSAPSSNNATVAAPWPWSAACISGVQSCLSRPSSGQPTLTSNRQASSWPYNQHYA